MVLLKPACGSSSNLKCLENVLYHNTHWAPKVKEMPILTGAQAAEKSLSMMKTIPFRHGVPIPASIQHNHYLMNIVTNGTSLIIQWRKNNTFTKLCLKVSLESIDGLQLL